MILAGVQFLLQLPGCHSLKEKRQTIQSLLVKTKKQFNVASAEIDHQDQWDLANLGFVTLANNRQYCQKLLDSLVDFIRAEEGDFYVSNHETSFIQVNNLEGGFGGRAG